MRLIVPALGLILLFSSVQHLEAQAGRVPAHPPAAASTLFSPGEIVVGPSLLVGNIDGGGLALGGEVEYGLTRDPRIGSGTIGLAFRIHSYSWNVSYGTGFKESLRVTPIAVAGNYHFALKSPKLDPYVGLALGYATASYSVSDGFSSDQVGSANSGLYLMIDGGGRYYLNPRTAIQAGISLGSRGDVGLLRLAAMFRL